VSGLAEVLCSADDSMHHSDATDDYPCWHCKQKADVVLAWIAERLDDPATGDLSARAITALAAGGLPWRSQTPREHSEAVLGAVRTALGVTA